MARLKGGCKQIRIATTENFTAPAVTIGRGNLLKEGQEWPKPDIKNDELADERKLQAGVVYGFAHNLSGVPEADYTTISGFAADGVEVFVEYTSLDGATKTVVKNVILMCSRSPVVEFGKVAFMRIEGTASGTKESDVITVTTTP
ncbi:MAG: hypothetical protein IAE99_08215 [Rhodothermales bacterium]|nr:hypothetical protein [Rhodothermales bacterium]